MLSTHTTHTLVRMCNTADQLQQSYQQHIGPTKVERMLGRCLMNGVLKRFQRNSTFSRTTEMLNRCSTFLLYFQQS